MARFVRFLALHILCVAFIPWPDTSAQIDWLSTGKSTNARSTTMMTSTSTASSMTFVPSHFLTPSIMTTISSIKPSNSSSIKPSNTSSIKPFNTSSIKPSNTSSIKPSNTSSIKPSNTSSIKPSNTSSIKPSNTSSIKPSNTSSIKPSNTSSIKPSNTSSTVTMTSIHNMTVTPHSTTTPSRTTVLPIHNTTVMPLHSTRIKPSSAHSVMPTSSVAPKPPAHQGNFIVKQNGSVCLIADMEAQFTISYKHKKKLENVTVTLPTNATASGMCRSKLSSIVLMWPPERNLYQFTLNFSQSSGIEQAKSGAWVMDHFTLVIFTTNNTQFPGAEGPNITFTSSKSLLNSTGKAYKCIHGSLQYNLKNGKTQSAKITIKNYEFQPFDVKHGTFSDDVQHCPADNPRTSPPTSTVSPTSTKNNSNKTVAIAVGCSLAGLVVIVLVGYLIGRRRSRSQAGYRKL